ncbi:hypothetical protein PGT21_003572 [Puccinia graminis f. sp. tritici]|uniref:Uncharacterized protein n=1 Tax=Puccinia graminis f. sp. tritici TaxID=56615 RepID=A0A5B0Q4J5_PUCGR|nr:hypothetical protein PGT21_003572 [Puccinia graminis f. sp. tritici]
MPSKVARQSKSELPDWRPIGSARSPSKDWFDEGNKRHRKMCALSSWRPFPICCMLYCVLPVKLWSLKGFGVSTSLPGSIYIFVSPTGQLNLSLPMIYTSPRHRTQKTGNLSTLLPPFTMRLTVAVFFIISSVLMIIATSATRHPDYPVGDQATDDELGPDSDS